MKMPINLVPVLVCNVGSLLAASTDSTLADSIGPTLAASTVILLLPIFQLAQPVLPAKKSLFGKQAG